MSKKSEWLSVSGSDERVPGSEKGKIAANFREIFECFVRIFKCRRLVFPVGNSKFSGLSDGQKIKVIERIGVGWEGAGQWEGRKRPKKWSLSVFDPNIRMIFKSWLMVLPIWNSKFTGLSDEQKFREFERRRKRWEGAGQWKCSHCPAPSSFQTKGGSEDFFLHFRSTLRYASKTVFNSKIHSRQKIRQRPEKFP